MKIAAIIPAHNEKKNILAVLRVVMSSPLLSEIIVVDDGSSDGTAAAAQAEGVRVIRQENRGKAGAMATGARATDAEVLFFSDADLLGFTTVHLTSLLAPLLEGRAGMTVGLRDRGPWMWWLLEYALPVIGGERAILRDHFLRIVAHRSAQRYGIETVMNAYCKRHALSVILVRMPGVTLVRKEQKVGLVKGLFQRIAMFGQILRTEIALLFERNV